MTHIPNADPLRGLIAGALAGAIAATAMNAAQSLVADALPASDTPPATEQVADAVAYMEVTLQPRGVIQVSEPRQIFRGWMFASAPAISGLQHPVYDAWVVGCKA